MEFICSKKEIETRLKQAKGVIDTKTTLSILATVLIETGNNEISLTGINLEVGFKASIPAEINSSGSVVIEAKYLLDLLKTFPECNLKFSMGSDEIVTLSPEDIDSKLSFKIKIAHDAEDFPKIPVLSRKKTFSYSQPALKSMIKKTIFSASTEEARYFLNGIFFEKIEEKFNLAATDGKRLAFISTELQECIDSDFEKIVPLKILKELVKNLGKSGTCDITLTEDKVFFNFSGCYYVSNFLEGQFPNYRQVIPPESKNILKVNVKEITGAIKRISSMIDPKLAQIRFDLSKDKLSLYGLHKEKGESTEELSVQYAGEEFSISFNYHFLLQSLKEIDSKECFFEMNDKKSPAKIIGEGVKDYFSVIMPMKIIGEDD